MVNKQLGRYTILEELGSGGFGTVYKATDSIGRTVAIKVLKPGWSDDPSTIDRFRREAQAAGALFHNRIATIIDFDENEGRSYLVMRYIDGESLDKRIKAAGPLPWGEAMRILSEVADGLDYAHQHGFIHRDIKPSNILISAREGAVLTDFGLVKAAEASGLSTSGVMLGTPAYIAPESWEGKEATPATDIYSLACVAFEMVTGSLLFAGKSPPEIMTRHMTGAPQFPEHWPEGVPEGCGAVLKKALSRDPQARHASASAFIAELGSTRDQERQQIEQQAVTLLGEAEALLKAGDLQGSGEKLVRAEKLFPGVAGIGELKQKLEAAAQTASLYGEAVDAFHLAEGKARQVLQKDPQHPDPQAIFLPLGLRGVFRKDVKKELETPAKGDLEKRRGHEKFAPWLLILLGLLTSWSGIGILGLVAGIGLFKRKNWARKAGMVFAGLLEFAGLGAICFGVGYLTGIVIYWQTTGMVLPVVATGIVGMLLAFYLFQILGGPRLAAWTGAVVTRPPGIWRIVIAYMATILGIFPAVLLLSRRKGARLWAQAYAILLMVALPLAGLAMALNMGIFDYDYDIYQFIYLGTNTFGQILTGIVAVFFFILCVLAFRALRKPEVRAYFENPER